MLKRLKIRTKLLLAFGSVAVITLVLGLVGYFGLSHGEKAINEIGQNRLPGVESLLTIKESAETMRGVLRTFMVPGLPPDILQDQYDALAHARGRIQKAWDVYAPLPKTEEGARVWEQFVGAWEEWLASADAMVDLRRQIDANGIADPADLAGRLEQFNKDHYILISRVLSRLSDPTEIFDGGDDPTVCNTGRFFAEFVTGNEELAELADQLSEPHRRFHQAIGRINERLDDGYIPEAGGVYRYEMRPAMQAVFAVFGEMQKVIDDSRNIMLEALSQGLGEVTDKQNAALALLDQLVRINSAAAVEEVASAQRGSDIRQSVALAAMLIGVLLALLLGVTIARVVSRPIMYAAQVANRLKEGDLTVAIKVDSQDEAGQMLAAMKAMIDRLHDMMKNIAGGVQTLFTASQDLSAISEQMSRAAQNTSDKSNVVATASEEMSSNMSTVAAAMEQSATNTQAVATAAEQMSATVNEIAKNSERARSISDSAAHQATETSGKMAQLGDAARAIGNVVEAITDISEQVNLLALNATIEAARAGEAGKGFAVVANEIKELAKQTAGATQDIKEKIGTIQGTTALTVKDIEEITRIIQEVHDVVSGIATAVEEQSTATTEIANNVSQAAQGIQEVNTNVSQGASVANEISRDIADVNTTANEMSSSSAQVNMSAGDLSKLAEELKGMVGQFKI